MCVFDFYLILIFLVSDYFKIHKIQKSGDTPTAAVAAKAGIVDAEVPGLRGLESEPLYLDVDIALAAAYGDNRGPPSPEESMQDINISADESTHSMASTTGTIVVLSLCGFFGNFVWGLTGQPSFLYFWQVIDLAGYGAGDFKQAIFIQGLSMFSAQVHSIGESLGCYFVIFQWPFTTDPFVPNNFLFCSHSFCGKLQYLNTHTNASSCSSCPSLSFSPLLVNMSVKSPLFH